MIMSVGPVIVLGEPGLVAVNVPITFERDHDLEAVRLGDIIDRFPVRSVARAPEELARAILAQGLDADRVGVGNRQPESRRRTGFVNRYKDFALVSLNALQFGTVNPVFA